MTVLGASDSESLTLSGDAEGEVACQVKFVFKEIDRRTKDLNQLSLPTAKIIELFHASVRDFVHHEEFSSL